MDLEGESGGTGGAATGGGAGRPPIGGIVLFIGGLLLLSGWAPAMASPAASTHVRILFDLGDGTYRWANVEIGAPGAWNASWDATLRAAAAEGLQITWSWYQGFGVFVTDVDHRAPPAVGLFVWNRTTGVWDASSAGISNLTLRDGDGMALNLATYDPETYAIPRPVPSPLDPYPGAAFREDLSNTGASPSTAPGTATLAWDRDTGNREVGSTPAVAYGHVFVNSMGGLFCLNATDGLSLWSNPRVRGFSTPTVFDGSLFVGGSDGRIYRLNASTGKEEWNTTLLQRTSFSGITSSPKVLYDRVYVGTFNESGGEGEVVALWARNGSVAWRYATASIHYSSPALTQDTLYVGVMGRYNVSTQVTFDPPYGLLALGLADGSLRWFFPTQGSVAASPAVVDSGVVFPSKDGTVYSLDARRNLRWKVAVGAGVSSPAVGDGLIIVGGGGFDGNGTVVALEPSSGRVRWSFKPNGPVQASIALADHRVFFSTNTARGRIYALNSTTGAKVWSYEPQPNDYILGSPVAASGKLYAPSDNGHIYAFQDPSSHRAVPFVNVLGPWIALVAGVSVILALVILLPRRWRGRARGP